MRQRTRRFRFRGSGQAAAAQRRPSVSRRWRRHLRTGLLLLGLVALGLFAVHASAATEFTIENFGGSVGLGTADLKSVVIKVIQWVLGILALIAVSFIIYGGLLWMTAAGDEKRILKAKKVIIAAVIGLIIVLLSWAIVTYVIKTVQEWTGPGTGGGGGGVLPPPGTTAKFAIVGIDTACGPPGDPRHNVYLCSGVSVTFSSPIQAATVQAAVAARKLVVERCDEGANGWDPAVNPNGNCTNPTTNVVPLNNPGEADQTLQLYSGALYTGTQANPKAEWVAPTNGGSAGNTVVFYHLYREFEQDRTYRLSVPKSILIEGGIQQVEECRKRGQLVDIPNCREVGDHYEWVFSTGVDTDTTPPTVASTYPDSRYLADSTPPPPEYHPDRNVNRWPLLVVNFSEAIDPTSVPGSIVLNKINDPLDVDPLSGVVAGGAGRTPVPPADYQVVSVGGGQIQIQLQSGNLLDSFTWYEVTVQGVKDLCQNTQNPDPYIFVFQTNDVAPGVAYVYPPNGFNFSCPDTIMQIAYTTSMYRLSDQSCTVRPANQIPRGYVTDGQFPPGPAGGSRTLLVKDDYIAAACGNNPSNCCKQYAFESGSSGPLQPNMPYQVGVNSTLVIDQAGSTLNYGDAANAPSAGPWSFTTKQPGECANPPLITALSPNIGPVGQCFTVQGAYFDPATTAPGKGPDDKLLFNTVELGPITPASWADTYVVTTAPDDPAAPPGVQHDVQVKVKHPDPIGLLESNKVKFDLTAAQPSEGPCLAAIAPTSGGPGTSVNLWGVRFKNPGAASRVLFSGDPNGELLYFGPWTDTFIGDARIELNSNDGDVKVRDLNGNESNGIPFNYIPPLPGRPTLTGWWPGCDAACVNAAIGGKFDQNMDAVTISAATVELRRCGDAACTLASLDAPTQTNVTYVPGNIEYEFSVTPTNLLSFNERYRVIVHGGPAGVKGASGGELSPAALIFDRDGDLTNDSFSWTFKVKNDPNACALDHVEITPRPSVTRRVDPGDGSQAVSYQAWAVGSPDSCNANGQYLNATAYDWTWNSDRPGDVSITQQDLLPPGGDLRVDPVQTATPLVPTEPPVGAGAILSTTAQAKPPATSLFIVSQDPTFCNQTGDCLTNEVGDACDSVCQNNRCTTVINDIDLVQSPVGSWVTFKGCWFGNYVAGQSTTWFSKQGGGEEEGDIPDTSICPLSATWKNWEVVREVPVGAATGPARLVREDGNSDSSAAGRGPPPFNFQVGGNLRPSICQLDPDIGTSAIEDDIKGKDLGVNMHQLNGNVTYHNNKQPDFFTGYLSWADQLIRVYVPNGVETGDVTVSRLGSTSNSLTFRVNPNACASPCTADNMCGANEGCGYTSCCGPRPNVSSNAPAGGLTCRNVVITVGFNNAPIDPNTVNTNSVKLYRDNNPPNGGIEVAGLQIEASENGIVIRPPLLDGPTTYFVNISNAIRSPAGVRIGVMNKDYDPGVPGNDTFEWDFTTGPEICGLERVVVDPNAYTFSRNVAPGNTNVFTAQAYAGNGEQIHQLPGVYDWDWDWALTQAGVVQFTNPPPPPPPDQRQLQALANGQTLLMATAKAKNPAVGFQGSKSGSSQINVYLCDNRWTPMSKSGVDLIDNATLTMLDQENNCDLGAPCNNYNFSLNYCRDQNGTQLLPDFNYALVRGWNGTRWKEYVFTPGAAGGGPDPQNKDGIGLLVFDNPSSLSPQDWLEQNKPGESAGGQAFTFKDYYPAYRLGTTNYIAATNLDDTVDSCVDVPGTENLNLDGPLPANVADCNPPGWRCNATGLPQPDQPAPTGGVQSAFLDASNSAGQYYLAQTVAAPSPTDRTYRIEGDVRVRRVNQVPNTGAGLITRCNGPDAGLCTSNNAASSFDRWGLAPGGSGVLGEDSGWVHIAFNVRNYITNPNTGTYANVGLDISCFAMAGWQVWCDNIDVEEVTNVCTAGTLKQNIYALSVNPDASASTLAIYDQLLSNLELNMNPLLNVEDRQAIARDSQRFGDIRNIKKQISRALSQGKPLPDLTGGTFAPNVSTSKWFSWDQTLGAALGAQLPRDPLNNFDPYCRPPNIDAGYEESTCWNEAVKRFFCPTNSHIYAYQFKPGGCQGNAATKCSNDNVCGTDGPCNNPAPSYSLGANLEYAGPGTLRGGLINLCAAPSECNCFTYKVDGP